MYVETRWGVQKIADFGPSRFPGLYKQMFYASFQISLGSKNFIIQYIVAALRNDSQYSRNYHSSSDDIYNFRNPF
jgi:hypothetical protein